MKTIVEEQLRFAALVLPIRGYAVLGASRLWPHAAAIGSAGSRIPYLVPAHQEPMSSLMPQEGMCLQMQEQLLGDLLCPVRTATRLRTDRKGRDVVLLRIVNCWYLVPSSTYTDEVGEALV
jgi:hypothetical protein